MGDARMSRLRTFVAVAACALALMACATTNADRAGAQRQQVSPGAMNASEGGGGGGGY
jgi:hypothetical protein